MNQVLTAAVTVSLGLGVLVAGQIAQRFFLDPIQEQRRVIGEIAYAVIYYGNVGKVASAEEREETRRTLRELSGRLHATLWAVPRYRRFESLGAVEKEENVVAAYTGLIGWSNSVSMGDDSMSSRRRSEIIKALGLPPS